MRRERAEKREREERERAAEEEEKREKDIALGNPLLNKADFNIKRRWDDDVVFKNQARGTGEKREKEFVNVSVCPFLVCGCLLLTGLTGSVAFGFPQAVYEQICQVKRKRGMVYVGYGSLGVAGRI